MKEKVISTVSGENFEKPAEKKCRDAYNIYRYAVCQTLPYDCIQRRERCWHTYSRIVEGVHDAHLRCFVEIDIRQPDKMKEH